MSKVFRVIGKDAQWCRTVAELGNLSGSAPAIADSKVRLHPFLTDYQPPYRCLPQLYDIPALRMSPNAASAQKDKQSLHYIVRSGLAGGVAGCVVSASRLFSRNLVAESRS